MQKTSPASDDDFKPQLQARGMQCRLRRVDPSRSSGTATNHAGGRFRRTYSKCFVTTGSYHCRTWKPGTACKAGNERHFGYNQRFLEECLVKDVSLASCQTISVAHISLSFWRLAGDLFVQICAFLRASRGCRSRRRIAVCPRCDSCRHERVDLTR
jgi:hypothetical protein